MRVMIDWAWVPAGDDGWQESRCLYAYLPPQSSEILYVGKAWSTSVRGRWAHDSKRGFWSDLERLRGIHRHRAQIGRICLPAGYRLSHELLCDIESLLIFEIQPWGNIQCRTSRITRPGLTVSCAGLWTLRRRNFRDGELVVA